MIGRKFRRSEEPKVIEPKGFDDFDLRLGDLMRGERATLGKSLLDVQRELRIKASYIAAIENCDPSAFDTPGFIAGYVRSYARYLGMDPDDAYATFCRESGFAVAHGMSDEASVVRKAQRAAPAKGREEDSFALGGVPFGTPAEGILATLDPRAMGSVLVLVALIAGLGYGGVSILREVQQVQLAPVEQAPVVLSDIDPLQRATSSDASGGLAAPSVEALDRIYRPQALDVPVLVARDAPIATLDPRSVGTFAAPAVAPVADLRGADSPRIPESVPQVVEAEAPRLRMVAVRPAWVRVSAADGSVIFEGIMETGQSYDVPRTEEPPLLRVGESGAIYFDVNGDVFGPVGARGTVTSNFALAADQVTAALSVADLTVDDELARMVAEAQARPAAD